MNMKRVMDLARINASFADSLALGQIEGAESEIVFGQNLDIGTTEFEDLWSAGGTRQNPDNFTVVSLNSDSANDIAAGTHARKVEVYGLDQDYNPVREEVTLNGQTDVSTTASFWRVLRLTVTESGNPENSNFGTIEAKIQDKIQARIPPVSGVSQDSHFTTPAGRRGIVKAVVFSIATNDVIDIRFRSRELGKVWLDSVPMLMSRGR